MGGSRAAWGWQPREYTSSERGSYNNSLLVHTVTWRCCFKTVFKRKPICGPNLALGPLVYISALEQAWQTAAYGPGYFLIL